MLDVHRLRLLREFAERGTIAATAAALGYTPSAVSQQLAALEREAGAALLDRSARAAELTDAGRRLVGHAAEILALIEAAEADVSAQEPVGRVAISAFPTAAVAFAPALTRTVRAHEGLTLLLRQTGGSEGLRQVRAGQVDVAIVDDWTGRTPAAQSGGLRFYPLVRDSLVLVVPRRHWVAGTARAGGAAPAAQRVMAGPAGRGAVPPRGGPGAGRGGGRARGALGVRGPGHDPEPGRAGHRDRGAAPADAGRGRGPGGGPRAARPQPGPQRLRGGQGVGRAAALGGRHPGRAHRGRAQPGPPRPARPPG